MDHYLLIIFLVVCMGLDIWIYFFMHVNWKYLKGRKIVYVFLCFVGYPFFSVLHILPFPFVIAAFAILMVIFFIIGKVEKKGKWDYVRMKVVSKLKDVIHQYPDSENAIEAKDLLNELEKNPKIIEHRAAWKKFR